MSDLLESLSKNPMVAVMGILFLACILTIPCIFYSRYLKNKEKRFMEVHEGQSFLTIYGKQIKIDGKNVKSFERVSRAKESLYTSNDYINVVLDPGEHVISALFGKARSLDNLQYANQAEAKLILEPNCQYMIGCYAYSATQRKNYYSDGYYDGDLPPYIFDQQIGERTFLICYKENNLNGDSSMFT